MEGMLYAMQVVRATLWTGTMDFSYLCFSVDLCYTLHRVVSSLWLA